MGLGTQGARIAELGPGVVFGSAAYLRSAGADVTVIDRWLTNWSNGYHDIVYKALIRRIESDFPENDCGPLRRLISDGKYLPSTLNALQEPVERLESVADASFDAVVSNAVLEHIADPVSAFSELFRITRSGGVGIHQVDYRDHRNFSAPLEHLLLPAREFNELNRSFNMEYGSQRRHSDYLSLFVQAGFTVEAYHQNATAAEDYVDDFVARAKVSSKPLPAHVPRSELTNLGGLFLLRRP